MTEFVLFTVRLSCSFLVVLFILIMPTSFVDDLNVRCADDPIKLPCLSESPGRVGTMEFAERPPSGCNVSITLDTATCAPFARAFIYFNVKYTSCILHQQHLSLETIDGFTFQVDQSVGRWHYRISWALQIQPKLVEHRITWLNIKGENLDHQHHMKHWTALVLRTAANQWFLTRCRNESDRVGHLVCTKLRVRAEFRETISDGLRGLNRYDVLHKWQVRVLPLWSGVYWGVFWELHKEPMSELSVYTIIGWI